jgi:nucleoside-diphosphate-sugar epimerase
MTYIQNEAELEERLSRPSDADAAALAALEGDLLILGVGGKMGPSLARLARRAADKAGVKKRIIAVARFSNPSLLSELAVDGIETISCDLLESEKLAELPEVPNVIFMAARKFGTAGVEHLTWAMNTYLPGLIAERYRNARIVAFSTGNVYPLRPIAEGGAIESTPVAPVGEYAQSALGRERMFEYGSAKYGTPVAILRLNYAIDLRYGVLVDIGRSVYERRSIDLRMPLVNVIWQGDANSWCLRSFPFCQSPPFILNITGPETLSVRDIAISFGELFGIEPKFLAESEGSSALLNEASQANKLFGNPAVSPPRMMEWIAHWIQSGGAMLDKPTHFQTRDGKF